MKKPQNRQITLINDEFDETDSRYKQEVMLTIYYLPVKQQIRFTKFMVKTIGGPLAALSDSKGDDKIDLLDKKIDSKLIGMFMEKLVEFDEETLIDWCEKLLDSVEVDGVKKTMQKDFNGDMVNMFTIIRQVIEVNFKSFLKGSTGFLSSLKNKTPVQNASAK